jgi:putative PIN family toxin of toxin-antitoxin system
MRVVLDTNIIVSTLSKFSLNHQIFRSLIDKQYELLITNDILLEYSEVLQSKYSAKTIDFFISFLQNARNVIKIDSVFKWNMITVDPDDNKFVDCYIAGRADYLVTNDGHFNILKSLDFPNIIVVDSNKFIEILKARKL